MNCSLPSIAVRRRGCGLGLVLALATAAGCAVAPPLSRPDATAEVPVRLQGARGSRAVVTWQDLRWQDVVRQGYDFSCGSAALATLLTHGFGEPHTERELLQEMLDAVDEPTRDERIQNGLSMLDLKQAAIRHGFQAMGARLPLSSLRQLRGPVIVHLNRSGQLHFSVLRGVDTEHAYLADPAEGNIRLSVDQFSAEWSGVILALARPGASLAAVTGLPTDPTVWTLDELSPARRAAPATRRPGE